MRATTISLIATKVHFFRERAKVLLDVDLAVLYGVRPKRLKEAVRRNKDRFPKDFMFQLSAKEWQNLRTQFASSSWGGQRYRPFAFTEQGVAMLSGVLNSSRAIKTNIAIMRTFVALRNWMQSNKELAERINQLENKYDAQFKIVFDAIRQLIQHRLDSGSGQNPAKLLFSESINLINPSNPIIFNQFGTADDLVYLFYGNQI